MTITSYLNLILGLLAIGTLGIDTFDSSKGIFIDKNLRPIAILNGHNKFRYVLDISAEQIESNVSTTFSTSRVTRQCDHAQNINDLTDEANLEMKTFAIEQIKLLAVDKRIKLRQDRSVVLATGTALAASFVGGIGSNLVDRLLGSRQNTKLEKRLEELEHTIKVKSDQIIASQMELCLLDSRVFAEKLNTFVQDYKLEVISTINTLVEGVLKNSLEYSKELAMCMQVNPNVASATCAHVVQTHSFYPELVAIKETKNGGKIILEMSIPIVLRIIPVFRIYSLGIPSMQDGKQVLSTALVPQYISADNLTYSGEFKSGITWADSYLQKSASEYNCLANTTCDVSTREITEPFLLTMVDGQNIVTSWSKCTFTYIKNSRNEVQMIDIGVTILDHESGQLLCAGNSIHIIKSVLSGKVEMKKSHPKFNPVSGILYEKTSILDKDHIVHSITAYKGVTLGHLLLPFLIILAFISIYFGIKFYKTSKEGINHVIGDLRIK